MMASSSNIPNRAEEHFQVDRSTLQRMMLTFKQGKSMADLFFEQIMKKTTSYIEWPQTLDDDRQSEHPTIYVSGTRSEDVAWAKALILENLEVNNSVFTLTMSISNMDYDYIMHRHINNINTILDGTKTHIEFPDPNNEKRRNEITIRGALDDLEIMREELRLFSPVVVSFQLPTLNRLPPPESVGILFKVCITYSSSNRPDTFLVMVRASVRRIDSIIEATNSMLHQTLGKMARSAIVSVQFEVPPQHHELVKGENCENIISIMARTKTKIFFPDLSIKERRRAQVTITGSVEKVLEAREELIGRLPIELTFDISSENESATEIMELGRREISQKERDGGMSVIIKGSEKSATKMYQFYYNIRQINSAFSSDLRVCQPFSHDEDLDNYIENMLEKGDNESVQSLNEQSPVTSTPDFTNVSAQYEIQYNNWMFYYQSVRIQNAFFQQQYQQHQYYSQNPSINRINPSTTWIPNNDDVNYNNSYPTQDVPMNFVQPKTIYPTPVQNQQSGWTICEPYGAEETQVQTYPAYFEEVPQNTRIECTPQEFNLSFENRNNSEYLFENDSPSSTPVKSSPLIVGAKESVAGKLICTGWGNIF